MALVFLRKKLVILAIELIDYTVNSSYAMAFVCFMEKMFKRISRAVCSTVSDPSMQEGSMQRICAGGGGLFKDMNVAFVCDGNRRYMKKHGLKDDFMREEGLKRIYELIYFGYQHDIKEVSFFCFGLKNFGRSREEVRGLMEIIKNERHGVTATVGYKPKFKIYGRLDLLEEGVREKFLKMEEETKDNTDICVNIFFAYSAEDELSNGILFDGQVDVLVRTGNVRRLSDFMLRQVSKGTAVFFPNVLWPEFTTMHARLILIQYHLENKYLLNARIEHVS